MTENPPSRPDEFALIDRYFAPLATSVPGAAGLQDDVATFQPTPGCEIVLTVDAIVAGVHFLPDDPPALVARKLLRVNLSDLAAKGADARTYLLAMSLAADVDEAWIAAFAGGLAQDQQEFGIALSGGDTTASPGPTTLSLTAVGEVPAGSVIRRRGAADGEDIYMSGTAGDAALALRVMNSVGVDAAASRWPELVDRFRLPRPRTRLGPALRGIATSALDVSDGLVADLGHICAVSGVSAAVELDLVPLSATAHKVLDEQPAWRDAVLGGGDDYEILFTASPANAPRIAEISAQLGLPVTRIGRIGPGSGVTVRDAAGQQVPVSSPGWRHF